MSHPACVTFNSDWKQLKYIDAYSNNTELFTNKLPLSTSSMVSSGFWEDSESLNRSETDPGQLIGSGMIVHNQSAHLSLRSSGNDDLINRNLDECTQVDKSLRASRRSMNDCADAKNKEIAPKDYAILKHLNVSSTCPNIQQAVHGDPSTMNTVLIKSHQLGTSPVTLPEKDYCNGVSTKFNHQYWKITTDWSDCDSDEPPHKRTNIPSTSRVSNKFCSSQDSSDSEYEDDNIVDQQGREDEQQTRNDCNQNSSTVPRTRFETALRRARLAAQQRAELNVLQNVSVSGGIMPNWGSPIKIKSLREVIPLPSLLQHHQLRQHTSARDDDGLTVTPVKMFSNRTTRSDASSRRFALRRQCDARSSRVKWLSTSKLEAPHSHSDNQNVKAFRRMFGMADKFLSCERDLTVFGNYWYHLLEVSLYQ